MTNPSFASESDSSSSRSSSSSSLGVNGNVQLQHSDDAVMTSYVKQQQQVVSHERGGGDVGGTTSGGGSDGSVKVQNPQSSSLSTTSDDDAATRIIPVSNTVLAAGFQGKSMAQVRQTNLAPGRSLPLRKRKTCGSIDYYEHDQDDCNDKSETTETSSPRHKKQKVAAAAASVLVHIMEQQQQQQQPLHGPPAAPSLIPEQAANEHRLTSNTSSSNNTARLGVDGEALLPLNKDATSMNAHDQNQSAPNDSNNDEDDTYYRSLSPNQDHSTDETSSLSLTNTATALPPPHDGHHDGSHRQWTAVHTGNYNRDATTAMASGAGGVSTATAPPHVDLDSSSARRVAHLAISITQNGGVILKDRNGEPMVLIDSDSADVSSLFRAHKVQVTNLLSDNEHNGGKHLSAMTLQALATAVPISSRQRKFQRWTEEEDDVLRDAIDKTGPPPYNWTRISRKYFRGIRTSVQCKNRWTKILQPDLKKTPFTAEEDAILKHHKESGGEDITWTQIARFLPGRNRDQVRERWQNGLDPSLKKNVPWTEAENKRLFELQSAMGNKWTEIARLLPGRSENQVKNRWHNAKTSQRRMMKNLAKEAMTHERMMEARGGM